MDLIPAGFRQALPYTETMQRGYVGGDVGLHTSGTMKCDTNIREEGQLKEQIYEVNNYYMLKRTTVVEIYS